MLYSFTSEKLLINNLWSKEVADETTHIDHVSSDMVIKTNRNEDLLDRVNFFELDVGLKASFYGGLVEVEGSAGYLTARELKDNEASVTFHMTGKSHSKLFQGWGQAPRETFCNQEEKMYTNDIPTHFVSEVVYGADF